MNNATFDILLTNEIFGAVATRGLSDDDRQSFEASPHSFLFSKLGHDFGDDRSLSVVSNSDEEVHLVLPYYEGLGGTTAQVLQCIHLDDATGGEIGVAIVAAIATVSGAAITAFGSVTAAVVLTDDSRPRRK